MIAAPDLVAAKLMYTAGGNSQKSGGRTRTVRGFSTAAKKKSKPSEISNPASTPATRQLEPPNPFCSQNPPRVAHRVHLRAPQCTVAA